MGFVMIRELLTHDCLLNVDVHLYVPHPLVPVPLFFFNVKICLDVTEGGEDTQSVLDVGIWFGQTPRILHPVLVEVRVFLVHLVNPYPMFTILLY